MFNKNTLIVILILLSGCSNDYSVEAYKTDIEINSKNKEILRSRFTTVEFKELDIFLEWFTYDNDVINQAPYKLFFVIAPQSSNIVKIEINNMDIISSKKTVYKVNNLEWPIIINNENQARASYTFEPAFDFDFDAGEEIRTIIDISLVYKDRVVKKQLKQNWQPIKLKKYAPIL